jgi:hypothetical protein
MADNARGKLTANTTAIRNQPLRAFVRQPGLVRTMIILRHSCLDDIVAPDSRGMAGQSHGPNNM